jgi:uncharacterized membrane protein
VTLAEKLVLGWLLLALLWMRGYFIYKARRVRTMMWTYIIELAGICLVIVSGELPTEAGETAGVCCWDRAHFRRDLPEAADHPQAP